MSARPSLDDYIDVAERIAAFNEKYPDGSLQTIGWEVQEIGGQLFVVYRAAAYRTAEDRRPGHGTAWEPFPGTTPYTRNSELMNAETAAWGRAIVAVGLPANKKIASKQEVRARQEEQTQNGQARQPSAQPPQATERPMSAKQRSLVFAKAGEENMPASILANVVLVSSGSEPREFEGEEQAEAWLRRAMDRVPARLVDPILANIKAEAIGS